MRYYKLLMASLLFSASVVSVHASDLETLTLKTGKVYESVTIREILPDGIKIFHAAGSATIAYEDLTKEIQEELGGFDAEKAKAYREGDRADQLRIAKKLATPAVAKEDVEKSTSSTSRSGSSDKKSGSVDAGPFKLVRFGAWDEKSPEVIKHYWANDWSRVERARYRGEIVKVAMEAKGSGTLKLDIFWLGSNYEEGVNTTERILKRDRRTYTVDGSLKKAEYFDFLYEKPKREKVTSTTNHGNTGFGNHSTHVTSTVRHGKNYEGWVIRLSMDGKILNVRASNDKFKHWAHPSENPL
ncbi:hypothetical protein [Persicirhabdus sediminis]|uniref:Uncharacterized protein n=1 Tax=Persicirhabdus sediminis TaxID=454144 RepID=A0A8J7SGI3_9BACT|nr:hypothetical protein [Persicirhabdus sediminis]MBK1790140.1 hypothetical protein [Persicirhabdus sediminis]